MISLVMWTCHSSLPELQIENLFSEIIAMELDAEMASCWSDAAADCGEPQVVFPLAIRCVRDLGIIRSKPLSFKYLRAALMHAIAV